jgi:hypothetical protein
VKKYLIVILLLCSYASFSQNNSYENAWKALSENKRAAAEKFLEQAMQDPAAAQGTVRKTK